MDISEAPQLDWRVLNDEAQVASQDGRIVAIAYTVDAGTDDGRKWLEFCWIPVDKPDLVDVHFGLGSGAGPAWDTRWDATRRATEREIAKRSAPS
jgi:hypothetical protein